MKKSSNLQILIFTVFIILLFVGNKNRLFAQTNIGLCPGEQGYDYQAPRLIGAENLNNEANTNKHDPNYRHYFNSSDDCAAQDYGDPCNLWKSKCFKVYWSNNCRETNESFYYIRNPFYFSNTSQTQTNHFFQSGEDLPTNRDFLLEDGWVILDYNFGAISNQVDFPYIIMYNRFTGKERWFLCVTNQKSVSEIQMNLEHLNLRSNLTAVLAFQDSLVYSLDRPNARDKVVIQTLSGGLGDITGCNYKWVFMELTLAYDPCLCSNGTNNAEGNSLLLSGKGYNVTNYKFSGTIKGTIKTNGVESPESPVNDGFGKFNKALQVGSKAFSVFNSTMSTYNGFKNSLQEVEKSRSSALKQIEALNPEKSKQFPYSWAQWFFKRVESTTTAAATVSPSLALLGALPAAVGFLNTILSENSPTTSLPEISILDAKIELEGIGTDVFNIAPNMKHKIPQSFGSIANSNTIPRYQNALGVLNFPYEPDLKKTFIDDGRALSSSELRTLGFVAFGLKEPFKLVLNPAANVEIIDAKIGIDYYIGFTKDKRPFANWNNLTIENHNSYFSTGNLCSWSIGNLDTYQNLIYGPRYIGPVPFNLVQRDNGKFYVSKFKFKRSILRLC